MSFGPEVSCFAPIDPQEPLDRLRELGEERGLGALQFEASDDQRSCPTIPGNVVAHDLDGDGDVDLAFNNPEGLPFLFGNDGDAHFTLQPATSPVFGPEERVESASAIDLNGDGLPELVLAGWGHISVAQNLGDLQFGTPTPVFEQPGYPRSCFMSLAAGDIDGDGDLDIAVPGADEIAEAGASNVVPHMLLDGTLDRLLMNDDGVLRDWPLSPTEEPQIALMAAFSDRDIDGDLDLIFTTDRAFAGLPPKQFYRNDGPGEDGRPVLVEDGEAVGAGTLASAMGLVSFDQNGDGLVDYCVSDQAPDLHCLLSDGLGGYFESGHALGLTAPHPNHPDLPADTSEVDLADIMAFWTTWSLELVDLDNDGWDDLAATAGPVPYLGNVALEPSGFMQPDALYRGTPEGFVEVGHGTVFGSVDYHYGMASADLDGDGFRELIVGVHEGSPQLWNNYCDDGAWLEIDLLGPPMNRQGFGAQVEIFAGDRSWLRELHALRALGQSDSALHFGLGELDQIDRLVVRWPDGSAQEAFDLPTRRTLTLLHPEATESDLRAQ